MIFNLRVAKGADQPATDGSFIKNLVWNQTSSDPAIALKAESINGQQGSQSEGASHELSKAYGEPHAVKPWVKLEQDVEEVKQGMSDIRAEMRSMQEEIRVAGSGISTILAAMQASKSASLLHAEVLEA